MRSTARLAAVAALVSALAAAGPAAATCGSDGLSGARSATAGFHKLDRAKAAGYTAKVVDLNKITCIAEPGEGAMGVHYLNQGLLDDSVSATSPELVIYEPREHGKPQLVGLEYLTIKSVWDASHSSPPSLYGHEFMETGADNRFGLPPYYSLHAWIWKHNPSGMFAMWNPKVHCP
jgi:hypothetical protein